MSMNEISSRIMWMAICIGLVVLLSILIIKWQEGKPGQNTPDDIIRMQYERIEERVTEIEGNFDDIRGALGLPVKDKAKAEAHAGQSHETRGGEIDYTALHKAESQNEIIWRISRIRRSAATRAE